MCVVGSFQRIAASMPHRMSRVPTYISQGLIPARQPVSEADFPVHEYDHVYVLAPYGVLEHYPQEAAVAAP